MGRKQLEIITSDISGKQLAEDQAVVVTISDHPLLGNRSVELDADRSEIEKLQGGRVTTVSVALHVPGEPVRRIVVDAATFDRLFKGNVGEVLVNARDANSSSPAADRSQPRAGPTPSRPRVIRTDYTDPARFGQLHRGRVTEEEAALVRGDLSQANRNRAAAGQPPIDPNDQAEQRRYGFWSGAP